MRYYWNEYILGYLQEIPPTIKSELDFCPSSDKGTDVGAILNNALRDGVPDSFLF